MITPIILDEDTENGENHSPKRCVFLAHSPPSLQPCQGQGPQSQSEVDLRNIWGRSGIVEWFTKAIQATTTKQPPNFPWRPLKPQIPSVQFISVAQSCPTLCDPMNRSTPGLPVHHQIPEFSQTHVHRVSDAIQPSHPLLSSSPPAPNPSQHQSLFQWVNSSHEEYHSSV